MIKTALFDLASMKNVAVQWRTGHLLSFFVPTPRDLTARESPPPEICHLRQKKMLIPRGQRGGGGRAQLELPDALFAVDSLSLLLSSDSLLHFDVR